MLDVQGDYLEAIAAYELVRDRFGAELDAKQRTHIEGRIQRLYEQTSLITVDVDQADVQVVLDGELLGSGPLEKTVRVMPGKHVVVATLAEHVPRSISLQLRAGDDVRQAIRLDPVGVRVEVDELQETRRWPQWMPWTVVGAGVLVGATGLYLVVDAGEDVDAVDDDARDHLGPDQEPLPLAGDSRIDDAHRQEDVGISFLAVGGAVVVTGGVLLLFNQPRTVVRRRLPGVAVGPRGVHFSFRF
jgi:hypothetical protein